MSETDSNLSVLRRDIDSGRRMFGAMRFDATPSSVAPSRSSGKVPAAALAGLLAAALAWWPASRPPGRPSAAQGPRLERTVDASIEPGDDFFAYANGGWLKATGSRRARNDGAPATRSKP